MPDFDINTIPVPLIQAFKDKRGSLFVGAGLSVGAGLPLWEGLILELIQAVKDQTRIHQNDLDAYAMLAKDPNKFLMLAEDLRERLGETAFREYIIKRFDEECPSPTDTHYDVIKIPHNYIITTNYDTLIEDTFAFNRVKIPSVYTYDDSTDLANSIWARRKFILKAHGDARKYKEGVVLTERDYRKLIYSRPGYQTVLQVLFTTNTILFLGASLGDPEVRLFLSFLRNAYNNGGPQHYALLEKDKVHDIEADRWRKDFGITIISYDKSENYKQVGQFISGLNTLIEQG